KMNGGAPAVLASDLSKIFAPFQNARISASSRGKSSSGRTFSKRGVLMEDGVCTTNPTTARIPNPRAQKPPKTAAPPEASRRGAFVNPSLSCVASEPGPRLKHREAMRGKGRGYGGGAPIKTDGTPIQTSYLILPLPTG